MRAVDRTRVFSRCPFAKWVDPMCCQARTMEIEDMNHRRITFSLALTLIVGTSISLHSTNASADSFIETRPAQIDPDPSQQHAMNMAFNISDAFEYAAEKIEPSVVHITVKNSRDPRAPEGLGSGVIVDTRGYILTNNHVVETGPYITVRLADGRELGATLVGTFEETDLAVIKIQADDIVAAEFADSESIRVGQWVLAVGSPFGFDQTVTAGIVSAKGRGSASMQGDGAPIRLQEFIQTDAAINPGNSGGPLVDLHGKIVGINTAIISRTGSNNGLGFSIPADIAQSVMQQLIETGRVQRGWLGIEMVSLSPVEAHRLGIDGGVVVKRALDDGPALTAGLQSGDIIVELGGRSTENVVRLSNAIMLTKPNEPVEINYIRDGTRLETSAVVTNRDEQILVAQLAKEQGIDLKELGTKIVPRLFTADQNRRRAKPIIGFLLLDIDEGSPAAIRGMEKNDFIYQIDERVFDNAQEVEQYIQSLKDGETIHVRFFRGREPMQVNLVPRTNP